MNHSFLIHFIWRATCPLAVSAHLCRPVGQWRATQPVSPVKCRLIFGVCTVGIHPMEAFA
jgi:hypothetical protein